MQIFSPFKLVNLRKLHRHTTYQESWFISREDLNLLTINTLENTGLCHYVISVRKTSVVDIKMLILAIDGS